MIGSKGMIKSKRIIGNGRLKGSRIMIIKGVRVSIKYRDNQNLNRVI